MIRRAQHWTDTPRAGHRQRRRKVSNWSNFRRPDSNDVDTLREFEPTDNGSDPTASTGTPDHWVGRFDFTHEFSNGPLQFYVGDSTTPANRALIGFRRADNPRAWMNIKFMGVNPVDLIIPENQRRVRFVELWDNVNLAFRIGRHRVEKILRLKNAAAQTTFRFSLRIPDGYSWELTPDYRILIRDAEGVVQLGTVAPYGFDSSTTAPTPDGRQQIGCSIVQAADIVVGERTLPTFRLRVNQNDLDSAVYPVVVDPTATLTGSPDVEDNWLWATAFGGANGDKNAAAYTIIFCQGRADPAAPSKGNVSVIRLALGSLPAGSISGFRSYMSSLYNTAMPSPESNNFYVIKPANDWVVGTAFLVAQTGSSCHSYAKYSSQVWAGEIGCKMDGTDYYTDASPPGYTGNWVADTYVGLALTPSWVSDWRDGGTDNNGLLLRGNPIAGAVGANINIHSTETVTAYPPYFEIDYTAAPSGFPRHFTQRRN